MGKNSKKPTNRKCQLPKPRQFIFIILFFIGASFYIYKYTEIGTYIMLATVFGFSLMQFFNGVERKEIYLFVPEVGSFLTWKGRGLIFGFIYYFVLLALFVSILILEVYNLYIILSLIVLLVLTTLLSLVK